MSTKWILWFISLVFYSFCLTSFVRTILQICFLVIWNHKKSYFRFNQDPVLALEILLEKRSFAVSVAGEKDWARIITKNVRLQKKSSFIESRTKTSAPMISLSSHQKRRSWKLNLTDPYARSFAIQIIRPFEIEKLQWKGTAIAWQKKRKF